MKNDKQDSQGKDNFCGTVMQEPCWLNHKLVVLIFTNTCIVQLSIKDDQVCFFR